VVAVRAVAALLAHQSPDGHWHDYHLEVGAGRAWTTAYVGVALLPFVGSPRVDAALARAVRALTAVEAADGWGYNLVTACDADSTAWCVRFLTGAGARADRPAREVLLPYVDEHGDVGTFRGSRFGSWSTGHDDVAATVALALTAPGGDRDVARRVCARVLTRLTATEPPRPFWWADDVYLWQAALAAAALLAPRSPATRRAAASHAARATAAPDDGSSPGVFRDALAALTDDTAAHVLAAHDPVGARRLARRAELTRRRLRDLQRRDGLWEPSARMRVPDQRGAGPGEHAVDDRALVTTATCLMALAGSRP